MILTQVTMTFSANSYPKTETNVKQRASRERVLSEYNIYIVAQTTDATDLKCKLATCEHSLHHD